MIVHALLPEEEESAEDPAFVRFLALLHADLSQQPDAAMLPLRPTLAVRLDGLMGRALLAEARLSEAQRQVGRAEATIATLRLEKAALLDEIAALRQPWGLGSRVGGRLRGAKTAS